jgi:hypothetical protein
MSRYTKQLSEFEASEGDIVFPDHVLRAEWKFPEA